MRAWLVCLLLLAGAARADGNDWVAIERGRYLATAGDCVACHQAPALGSSYAGGRAIETPFGNILTPNITPDPDTGIGRWSADDFARALHEGVRPNGQRLYPAFPYSYYTRVTREDADALFAYLRSVPAVRNVVDRNALPFPLDQRVAMRGWNALFFRPGYFQPDPARSAEWNRGAYLVEGLGHCAACHTPMNALGGSRASRGMVGQALQGWTVPNITDDHRLGIGEWGADDIVQYLRTGATGWTRASGPMAEVVELSTSRMTEADLRAMATYLLATPARGSAAPAPVAATEARMRLGAAIYADNCMACHAGNGAGVEGLIPSLASNGIVVQPGSETLTRVVIEGVRGVATDAAPTAPGMPAFGWRLNDEQVSDVLTYIRNSWGNAAPAVPADAVRRARRALAAR